MSRILTSLHGRLLGLDSSGRMLGVNGFRAGDHGNQIEYASPIRAALWDDFVGAGVAYGTTIADGWRSRKGSDGACVDWTVTPAANGTIVGTIGNTTASMAVSGVQLDSGLSWRADMGDILFQARFKLSRITNIAVFVGLTDQTAALEMPIQSAASANTFTTNATDAVGVMFDTSMATADWWLTGVANDVDATMQDAGLAPAANTYETWHIAVNSAGAAVFFRNGIQIGSTVAGVVTPAIPLTPVVAAFNRTTSGAPTVTVDYLHVSAPRV